MRWSLRFSDERLPRGRARLEGAALPARPAQPLAHRRARRRPGGRRQQPPRPRRALAAWFGVPYLHLPVVATTRPPRRRRARRAARPWHRPRGAGPLHAGALGRLLRRVAEPHHQHPPLVPAGLPGRPAVPPGPRPGREARRGDRALRHRRARRRPDHRPGRHPGEPPRRRGRSAPQRSRPRGQRCSPAPCGPTSAIACSSTADAPSSSTDPGDDPTLAAGDLALVVAALCFGSTFVVVQDAVALSSRCRSSPCGSSSARSCSGPSPGPRPPRPGELRDGVLAGGALRRRLRAPDGRPAVHGLGHVGVHHLPAGGASCPVLGLVAPAPPTPPGHAGSGSRSPWSASCCSPIPAALASRRLRTGRGAHPRVRGRLRRPRRRSSARPPTATTRSAWPPSRWPSSAVVCLVPGLWLGGLPASPPARRWRPSATAVVATALAFCLQVFGQRTVPPLGPRCSCSSSRCSRRLAASPRGDAAQRRPATPAAALILAAVVLSGAAARMA